MVRLADTEEYHPHRPRRIQTCRAAIASPLVRPVMMSVMPRRITMRRWPAAVQVTSRKREKTWPMLMKRYYIPGFAGCELMLTESSSIRARSRKHMTTRLIEAMELLRAECLVKCARALDQCTPKIRADPRR